jgi:hypothetical protein
VVPIQGLKFSFIKTSISIPNFRIANEHSLLSSPLVRRLASEKAISGQANKYQPVETFGKNSVIELWENEAEIAEIL